MDFLQNLMIRHQTETTQAYAGSPRTQVPVSTLIVQPRQKLRFEGGSEPLVLNPEMNQESLADSQIPETQKVYPQASTAAIFSALDTGSTMHSGRLDRRLNEREQSASSRSDKLPDKQNEKQEHKADNLFGYKHDGHKNGDPYVKIDSLGKILQRLDPMPSVSRPLTAPHFIQPDAQLDTSHGLQSNEKNYFSATDQNSYQQRTQNSTYQNKQHSAQHEAATDLINTSQSEFTVHPASSPPLPSNSGSLDTPDWLNQLQVDLQERWQGLNHQAQAEPVINVTIGRVEVRAVQTNASQPSRKKSASASSVMTLDSYLQQRNRRGPV